jgi:hypothetical protein
MSDLADLKPAIGYMRTSGAYASANESNESESRQRIAIEA